MENINWGDVMYIVGNVLLNFGEFTVSFKMADTDQLLPNHTDSYCRKPWVSNTHTHTHMSKHQR